MNVQELLILICIGLAAGVLSGLFGIGGGVIMVPAMVLLLGMSQHNAQGTSIALMLLPIGVLAAYNYYQDGNLNIKYGLIIAAAFVVGGYFGSKLSIGMSENLLKKGFGLLMMVLALKMMFFDK
ncbi:MAG: sulfite exporter TauE/SafE family protein [Salibacteraceae bacterium]